MSSEVDVCNLALAHLGDEATVASISPPEGSAQAAHCARFYPIARDSLLEMHPWGFTVRREALAALTIESATSTWTYAYAAPTNMLNLLGVYGPEAVDDVSVMGQYTPQACALETAADGSLILLTNQADAVLRYTQRITDPTRFSPLFVDALAWLLASYLAGPLMKGETGAAAGRAAYQTFRGRLTDAMESDANQRRALSTHNVSWMAGRA